MTAKVEYKKELFSLPIDVSNSLKAYAKETHKKKSHIVAEALDKYLEENDRKKLSEEAKSIIGMISANTPDIQVIKANRTDI